MLHSINCDREKLKLCDSFQVMEDYWPNIGQYILKWSRLSTCKIKVAVNLSLPLTKFHAMKAYERVETQFHAFLILSLHGCEWLVSRPGRFTLGERDSGIH